MYSKLSILALCAATSIQEVAGASLHRHKHPKRDIVWAATDTVVFTNYVTVTVTAGQEAFSAKAISTSSPDEGKQYPGVVSSASIPTVEATTSSIVPVVVATSATSATSSPTTLATAIKSSSSVVESPVSTSVVETSSSEIPVVQYPTEAQTTEAKTSEVVATSTTSTAAAATTTAASYNTGGSKRGAAYNDASLVSTLLGLTKKISWAYNWGSDPGNLDSDVMYYPMLWSPAAEHSSDWDTKAEAAISRGSDHFLSFNEPDIGSQASMSPADAATGHIKFMNPYAGRVKISAPAISSSENAGMGLDWLSSFFSSCNGKCQVDFCAAHWYGPGGQEGADLFLAHIDKVHEACDNKPVWVTEFEAISGDADAFLAAVTEKLDSDEYSFVEKYSYFMLTEGSLLDTPTTLSSVGKIYAGVS